MQDQEITHLPPLTGPAGQLDLVPFFGKWEGGSTRFNYYLRFHGMIERRVL